jgi:hypothetical protein
MGECDLPIAVQIANPGHTSPKHASWPAIKRSSPSRYFLVVDNATVAV